VDAAASVANGIADRRQNGDYVVANHESALAGLNLVHRNSDQAATGLKVMRPAFDFLVCLGRGRDTISTSLSNAVRKAIRRSMEYSRKFPLNSRDTSG
jgi:hypothetical protein